MDKEQAKFLLRSFRPEGADVDAPEFAEALHLAAEDRELGEWLAHERAMDAAFAKALSEVSIPVGLREEILAVLEYDGQSVEADEDIDGLFVGGLASVQPPTELREQILTSMEMERTHRVEGVVHENHREHLNMGRWLTVAAMAAAVAVIAFVSYSSHEVVSGGVAWSENSPEPLIHSASIVPVSASTAMMQVSKKINDSKDLPFTSSLQDLQEAVEYLDLNAHPSPEMLPSGLKDARFMGVQRWYLEGGQPVSLMRFKSKALGMIYLIVLNSNNIQNADALKSVNSVSLKTCYTCSLTDFNVAQWRDHDRVYMLLTKATKQHMVDLF